MLSAEEISSALTGGYELRGLELKGPGPRTDSRLFAKVARAALSMGNLRDGGHVIIGLSDTDPQALSPGLSSEDLATWLAYDDIARKLAEYADPPLQFDVQEVRLSSGARVAVIAVQEFADVPHLCVRQFPSVLRPGALYVRPRKVPETSEVASALEMRAVLDLATEKALRAYVGVAERAGLALSESDAEGRVEQDRRAYRTERTRGWE